MLRPPSHLTKRTPGGGFTSPFSPSDASRTLTFLREFPKRSKWQIGVMIGVVILTLQIASLILFHASIFTLPHSSSTPTSIEKISNLLIAHQTEYDPRDSVGFAIPVGGRTERSGNLKAILENLVEGGARPGNIRIFEDIFSRGDGKASEKVREMVEQFNQRLTEKDASSTPKPGFSNIPQGRITIVHNRIDRSKQEDQTDFGIHLARHYKLMMDHMLSGDTPDQIEEAKDRLKTQKAIGVGSLTKGPRDPPYEFVVVIEDDLLLAQDFVKYFFQMSRLMRVDESLYCVAAHQDNAFLATSFEESISASSNKLQLDPQQFAFRRGNHFMAPGWMTSRRIYTEFIKDRWLDSSGAYKFKQELHLKNGHWDRFFDSLIGERDCIFPEIPRIIHEGAEGFTVSKKGQMELYTNLRLSSLHPDKVEYGDLARLSKEGYREDIEKFIAQATVLTVLEEITSLPLYPPSQKLVYLLPASSQRDGQWNAVLGGFFGLIGVGGYGGWEGYVKARGIWEGVVWVRWMNHLVLLVGNYSPFAWSVHARVAAVKLTQDIPPVRIPVKEVGCIPSHSFPSILTQYTLLTSAPEECLQSCLHLGWSHTSISNGGKDCRCGFYTPSISQPQDKCDLTCPSAGGSASTGSIVKSLARQTASLLLGSARQCGGVGFGSVYGLAEEAEEKWSTLANKVRDTTPSENILYVAGKEGESCRVACARHTPGARCAEHLFPVLHRSCPILSRLMGCSTCHEEADIERGFSTPGRTSAGLDSCSLSKGKYISCAAVPPPMFLRACVCEKETAAVPASLAPAQTNEVLAVPVPSPQAVRT